MDKYFVYYNDDYEDNGGVGMESFDTKEKALEFIEDRIKKNRGNDYLESIEVIDGYVLVVGKELKLKPEKVITKIVTIGN